MGAEGDKRRSYEESCLELQREGWLDPGKLPPMPARPPAYDDEELGVSFFRTRVTGDFSKMTLPRTFFGRSEVAGASFRKCDLSESVLCWNDFIGVDFSDCNLQRSDLRAAVFNRINFSRCDLRQADFRHSTFVDCDFTDADLRGAKLTRMQADEMGLSLSQRAVLSYEESAGEEPPGG